MPSVVSSTSISSRQMAIAIWAPCMALLLKDALLYILLEYWEGEGGISANIPEYKTQILLSSD